jgi:hypothetical protein
MSKEKKQNKEIIEFPKEKVYPFDEKVKSMSAKEIIMAMVDGLRNPSTKVDMGTFGRADVIKFLGITLKATCYGCAATNTICNISGKKFAPNNIKGSKDKAIFIDGSRDFVAHFEESIDCLRRGEIQWYNYLAKSEGFAQIKAKPGLNLPQLNSKDYLENLDHYVELANYQDEKA